MQLVSTITMYEWRNNTIFHIIWTFWFLKVTALYIHVHCLTTENVSVLVVMIQWEDYHTYVFIIGLYKSEKFTSQIIALLWPLEMSKRFIYCTIECYRDTGDVERIRSGRPRFVWTTKKAVEALRSRINRNPLRKQKKGCKSDENHHTSGADW